MRVHGGIYVYGDFVTQQFAFTDDGGCVVRSPAFTIDADHPVEFLDKNGNATGSIVLSQGAWATNFCVFEFWTDIPDHRSYRIRVAGETAGLDPDQVPRYTYNYSGPDTVGDHGDVQIDVRLPPPPPPAKPSDDRR